VNARNQAGQTPLALLETPQRPAEKPAALTAASAAGSGSEPQDTAASRQIAELLRTRGGTK